MLPYKAAHSRECDATYLSNKNRKDARHRELLLDRCIVCKTLLQVCVCVCVCVVFF